MTTEVELKYLVLNENVAQRIVELLNVHQLPFTHQVKQLSNCYYDTADLALRQLDMGLRIRIDGGAIEQTIKTAGQVVGGLHQRPEYNVAMTNAFPELSLFPDNIWPEVTKVDKLQAELIPLFNTDFTRELWQVSFADSEIELVFDQGEISSSGEQLAIFEIELELISGNRGDLFALAQLLFSTLSLRAGTESKAARGYQLFFKQRRPSTTVSLDIQAASDNIQRYFLSGIDSCLQKLQQVIADYLQTKKLTKLAEFVDILSLLRHGFWLFEQHLTDNTQELRAEISHFIQLFAWVDNAIYLRELMNKTGNYRKKLEYSEQLIQRLKLEKSHFPDYLMVKQLLHSERFNQLQLSLLVLVVDGNSSNYFSQQASAGSVTEFAKTKLSDSLIALEKEVVKVDNLNAEQYLAQRKMLHRSLLTGHWFGELFNEQSRAEFRIPWLDIKMGLRELQSLWIIKQQLEKLDERNEPEIQKIIRWQQSKVENLLTALSHSKTAALALPAYWLS
ncbi:CYTH domain-containing protein [Thalassotalea sp. G2M2-11]|uniref:CYTH domain-containing protein n=1 Tax=Thalassotalea sp. G2M2-11 TaxID=2787627 RepID=UPI0019D2D302|nr:CYTH domain-containing protein [Thalassotalea sp. G2M2-11]